MLDNQDITELTDRLTDKNYYDAEHEYYFGSASGLSLYRRNPRECWDYYMNGWRPQEEDQTALLLGNYLHSHFESQQAHGKWVAAHPEIISSKGSTKGQLKSQFLIGDKMIDAIERQNNIKKFIDKADQKEMILTGQIAGMDFKGKLDAVNLDKHYFIDYKTNRDPSQDIKIYDSPDHYEYTNFVKAYGYYTQMALYREMLKQAYGVDFMCYIVAVSKTKVPKVGLLYLESEELDTAYQQALENIPHYQKVLTGEEKPELTFSDDEYFWTHYQINHPVTPDEFIGDFRK
ncbi:MAG: PD-(D/E)XK nuclease-like domain-containing protein [Oenococcus sp.]|uniref:PD-(D/E)XK nuclease-like domain-containing protein n=1 Tax=Oenococcus sp. TaxID=1979414 RepID=UPI0039E9507C